MGYSRSEYAAFNRDKKNGNPFGAPVNEKKSVSKVLFSILLFPFTLIKKPFTKKEKNDTPVFMLSRAGYTKPAEPKLTKEERQHKKYMAKQKKYLAKQAKEKTIKREFDETNLLRKEAAKSYNKSNGKTKKRKPGEPYHKMHVKNPRQTNTKISAKARKEAKQTTQNMRKFIEASRRTEFKKSDPNRSRDAVAKRASSLRNRLRSMN